MRYEDVRVFKVDTEFIVALTPEDSRKYFELLIGEPPENEPEEIIRERWLTMCITDFDEPGRPSHTFDENIRDMITWDNQEYPKSLASTENY